MRHTEESIKRVKKSLAEMWLLVQGQVEKVSAALASSGTANWRSKCAAAKKWSMPTS